MNILIILTVSNLTAKNDAVIAELISIAAERDASKKGYTR